MKIGIIGAGNVGRALGKGWEESGHNVVYGVRNPSDEKHSGLRNVASVENAAGRSDIIVLATPWNGTESAIRSAGNLEGKVLIDCTNPLKPDLEGLTHGHEDSGGEQVARWAVGAKVVKAFNSVGANIMEDAILEGRRATMFLCGDDEDARQQVATLSQDLGFETIEIGGLRSSRLLEPLAVLWISCAYRHGMGRDFAFSIVRR